MDLLIGAPAEDIDEIEKQNAGARQDHGLPGQLNNTLRVSGRAHHDRRLPAAIMTIRAAWLSREESGRHAAAGPGTRSTNWSSCAARRGEDPAGTVTRRRGSNSPAGWQEVALKDACDGQRGCACRVPRRLSHDAASRADNGGRR
jgi:hypothetical protein